MKKRGTLLILLALAVAEAVFAQGYGGPSMLSRGGNRPGRRGRAPVSLSVYGAVRGTLDTGLTALRLDGEGNLVSDTVYGVQTEIGAFGTHSWRRTILGLDYRGDYRKSTNKAYQAYNGTNQALAVDLEHTLSRRTALFFRESAGSTNRAFGGFAAPAVSNVSSLNLANTELFDTRTYFSTTSGAITHRRSARLSLQGSADAFFVKRPDPRLVGVTGYRITGVIDYRLNVKSSVSTQYMFMDFYYPESYGGATANGIAAYFHRSITPQLNVTIGGGGIRLHTFGTERVRLSPEVALILGQPTGIEAFKRTAWVPQGTASMTYTLERSRFNASVTNGVTPGNGVYLTSRATNAMLGYSFSGTRKLSLGASANYIRMTSQALTIAGSLEQRSGGVGVNYVLTRYVNLSSQLDYRIYRSPGIRGREGFALAIGFTISPASIPLPIW